MIDHSFYRTLQKAIQAYKGSTGKKPSLLQISRQDYQQMINRSDKGAVVGLSIDGVTVIGLEDIEQNSFIFLP